MMEREQIAENMRFYGEMRFKQLTVWMAGMSLLVAGSVQYADAALAPDLLVRDALAVAAVVFTCVIWVMEVRSSLYWVANKESAPDLWPQRGVVMGKVFSATNVVFLLYLANSVAWLWLAYKWDMSAIAITILAILVLAILVFTVLNYWSLWTYNDSRPAQQVAAADAETAGRSPSG